MKRSIDFLGAVFLLVLLSIPILIIGLAVKLTSRGPMLYWSDRVGIDNEIFRMPKFRTMRPGAPTVATHLFKDPERYLTPIGSFLRRLSLDELPQLFSIVTGKMGVVGPRPALFNQHDLIELRTRKNIHRLMPGVTGWAQINGRDDLPIPLKVDFDEYYLTNKSYRLDAKILFMTIVKALRGEGVQH